MAITANEWPERFVDDVGEIHTLDVPSDGDITEANRKRGIPPASWRLSYQHHDGTIYLPGMYKTTDGGRTVVRHSNAALDDISILHSMRRLGEPGPEGAAFSRPGLFVALAGYAWMVEPGTYRVTSWRSNDELKTIEKGQAILKIPDGPIRDRRGKEWFGIYLVRTMLQRSDGTLLVIGDGMLTSDTIEPKTDAGKKETRYLTRVFVLASHDEGRTWEYLSTVAAPGPDDPTDEGYDEPTMTTLRDGRLLCIMRTGHTRPLYASWSSDGGKTWTAPVYTGMERGCLPCAITLADGRVAVSYGNRFPPGWSRITAQGDHALWTWPGKGLMKLAVSQDGTGEEWISATVARDMGSCYSTLFEVEPNVLFCQVDCWHWRMTLRPR